MRRLIIILCVLSAGLLPAAEHGGSVRASDQPVPGATVTVVMGDKKLTTSTDDAGNYHFADIPAGVWLVEVEMFGFVKQGRPLLVTNNEATSFDWNLEMGANPEPKPAVTVSQTEPAAAAPAPQPGRTAAATSTPATSPSSPAPSTAKASPTAAHSGNGVTSGNSGFVTLSLNAETPEATAMSAAPPPPPSNDEPPSESFLVTGSMSRGLEDARREEDRGESHHHGDRYSGPDMGGMGDMGGSMGPAPVRGMSSSAGSSSHSHSDYSRYSRRRGSSKSKTSIGNRRQQNDIRGSMYYSLRNSELDARPYSLSGQSVPLPAYAQNRFGVSAGGPLGVPKLFESEGTFFYFNYTGTRLRSPYNAISTLPSELERSGDFSQSYARGPVTIYDPLSQLPFPNDRIPQNRINPAVASLLSYIPLPTYSSKLQNYQYLNARPSATNAFGIRINQVLTRHDRLDFNVNTTGTDTVNNFALGYQDPVNTSGLSASASYTHNFSSHLTNSLRWNFSRGLSTILPYFAGKANIAQQLGITGTSSDPRNWGPPNLGFTNFTGLSDGTPSVSRSQTSSVSEGVTWVRHKHNLTFGGDYRRMQRNTYAENGRGGFSFSGIETSAFDPNGTPIAGTGFDFADFLLGFPQSSSIRFGAANNYFRAQAVDGWANDDWRARPNLSFNLGLRYEYFTPFTELYGHMANLDIAPGFTGVGVVTPGQSGPFTGAFPDALMNPDHKLLSPRTGVAWKPSKKSTTVLRAGYGLFFVGSVYYQFPGRLASQPPFATTAAITTSPSRVLTLQDGFAAAPKENVTNTYAVDKNYHVPYVQNWNFSLQHSFKHGIYIQGGYIGNKGTRLDLQLMPNRAAPGSPLTAEQRRMIGNATGFTFDTSVGNSIYHAANLQFQRRFQNGISFTANYTFSKAIDNASSFGGGIVQDAYDLRAERGLSSFDQRHLLSLGWYLLSPIGEHGLIKGGSKLTQRLFSNWALSGSLTFASGIPYTARVLGNLANTGGNVGSGRADATGAPITGGPGFFNLLAFTIPPSGRFGDAGRDTIPGLPRISANLGFGRSFSLSGDNRRRIEFRVESTNFTNHVNYTSVGTVVNAATYGIPLATAGMRTVNALVRVRF